MVRNHCSVPALLSLVFLLGGVPSISAKADEYWISYDAGICDEYRCPDPKYLMRIDALGNVLLRPQKVPSTAYRGPLGGATALAHSKLPGKLILLFGGRQIHTYSPVLRAGIDKRTLATLSLDRTELRTLDPFELSATQRDIGNFVVLRVQAGRPPRVLLVASSTSSPGTPWLLTECVLGSCDSALSADGRMFGYTNISGTSRQLFLQPLGPKGRPIGKVQMIGKGPVGVADISGSLHSGERYLLYGEHSNLFLQVVDSKTGSKIGDRKKLASHVGQAAIDPLGRFVIYDGLAPRLGRTLMFQALDVLGNPSGRAKVIAPEAYGFDILKE